MTSDGAVTSTSTSIRTVATGLAFPEGPIAMADGSILVTEIAAGTLVRVSPDGRIERIAELGGGPNGAAIGPDGAAYVCNNGGSFSFYKKGDLLVFGLVAPPSYSGGSIDRVDLATGEVRKIYTACDGHPLRGPNDIIFDETGGFWFTDHGIRTERESDRTAVYYAQPDGTSITEAIFPLDSPNGIALSPDGSRLYVAETQVGRIWSWELDGPGKIAANADGDYHPGKLFYGAPGYTLFDSMAVDGDGWVCQATLINGGIVQISPNGRTVENLALPDPMITNICFGGPDHGTAYITCSGTGHLIAVDWPRPGGRLAFS
ncbi:MAG: SMP-30/gluconolactonase/LRE family protein [Alphaproteobacteria bacterium]|nr:SMP-30/gluconolactonase/LRE family protein [Alphaproteobacteria bacterium]